MVLIPVSHAPKEPLGRLVRRAEAQPAAADSREIGVVGPGDSPGDVMGWLERTRQPAGILVLGWIGTHRDARAGALRAQWELEEACRALPVRVLVLRLAPLLGPDSPLWLRLRAGPRLRGERPFQPIVEADVVETMRRVARDSGPWGEWYDVAGWDAMTLAELSELAARQGAGSERGSWEPAREILAEQKLVDSAPWVARFGIRPAPLAEQIARWVA